MVKVPIKAPRFDPSAEKITIVEWKKTEGETVKKGEELIEMVGEKTTFAYTSPCDGRVAKIIVREGEVNVGEIIGELDCGE
jgi:pyruvate/2-oxoglutarate dehydrogenase complex dihydrolipoamide acyltransferase (E2) component